MGTPRERAQQMRFRARRDFRALSRVPPLVPTIVYPCGEGGTARTLYFVLCSEIKLFTFNWSFNKESSRVSLLSVSLEERFQPTEQYTKCLSPKEVIFFHCYKNVVKSRRGTRWYAEDVLRTLPRKE